MPSHLCKSQSRNIQHFVGATAGSVQKSGVHQFRVDSFSHYLQGFTHPRWLFRISEPTTVCRDSSLHKLGRLKKIGGFWVLLPKAPKKKRVKNENSLIGMPTKVPVETTISSTAFGSGILQQVPSKRSAKGVE